MDFGYDVRTEEFRKRLLAFMDEYVYPAEPVFAAQVRENAQAGRPWERPAVIGELKQEARGRGLWNLFLAHHPEGAGLTNLAVRAARGDHRAQPGAGPRGAQLRRPRHREHGGAGRIRYP